MASVLRGIVSKKKKRFIADGFDLDLTYVTPRVIAMGFPSTGLEAVYRNPLPEVRKFFESRHHGHYKIYNLCSERKCKMSEQFSQVEIFAFDDHNPCPLEMIRLCCISIHEFLQQDEENVVAIHCKAGKGRTGIIIASYLLHCGQALNAKIALETFGSERTHDWKGVTIPSQIRYVYYYALLRDLPDQILSSTPSYLLQHIRLKTSMALELSIKLNMIHFNCQTMQFEDYVFPYDNKKCEIKTNGHYIDLHCRLLDYKLRGDVKLDLLHKNKVLLTVWFHTRFIERGFLCFKKNVIDKICKDKNHKIVEERFVMEIYFNPIDEVIFCNQPLDEIPFKNSPEEVEI